MQIEDSVQLDFNDVLIKPKRSILNSRSEVEVTRDYKFKWYDKVINGTGIISANMRTTGTIEVARVMSRYNMFTALHKFYSNSEIESELTLEERQWVFKSVGLNESIDLPEGVDKICLDVPNGYIPRMLDRVNEIRDRYDIDVLILAGNVVTGDMTQDLILNGTDIVKVGIGSGSACTTRRLTGVGRPQLSTIIDCSDAAHGCGGMICSDGGIVYPADICKAFGANTDMVMIGGFIAGTDEADGRIVTKGKGRYKLFYGMSSKLAQDRFMGGMRDYRASEGREVLVPYTGSLENKIKEILGGLRSNMTYIGASVLKDIPKCTTFYRVNRQLNTVFEK